MDSLSKLSLAVLLPAFIVAVAACDPPATQADASPNPSVDASTNPTVDAGAGNPDAATTSDCAKTFTLGGNSSATTVLLTGSFTTPTAWAATVGEGAIAMTLGGADWTVQHTLAPGRHLYKFIVDGTTWIHDAANPDSEDDGFGGFNSVFTCGTTAGACGLPDQFDWRDTVMYFAMVDRFHDSDGSADPVAGASGADGWGNSGQYEGGDLAGVRAKLPYLADLGVTALWLSAPFENRNEGGSAIDPSDLHVYSGYHGYWPSPANINYSDPNNPSPTPQVESRIGSDQDLRNLITDAHGATSANGDGIKVLFDYVMNHVDVNSGLYQAHPDWFVRDGANFALCGPGNLWDDPYWGTRCAFTDYLPPMDMYNPTVRNWSINDAVWWAKEYGIDGYRLDAIKHVPFEWLTDLRTRLNSEFSTPAGNRFYLVGETFDYFNRDLLKSYVQPNTMLDGQFDFPLKRVLCEGVFDPAGNISNVANFMAGNDSYYNTSPSNTAIMTTWIGNHDIPRAIHFADWRFGNCTQGSNTGNGWTGDYGQPSNAEPYERLGVAFAILMTNPGIPLLYYGDEIGLAGGGDPGNRLMMPWNDAQLNAHQIALRGKVRLLARLRGSFKTLGRGNRVTLSSDNDTWVYRMSCGSDPAFPEVIIAINKADSARDVNIPGGTYKEHLNDANFDGGTYSVPARSFAVFTPR